MYLWLMIKCYRKKSEFQKLCIRLFLGGAGDTSFINWIAHNLPDKISGDTSYLKPGIVFPLF